MNRCRYLPFSRLMLVLWNIVFSSLLFVICTGTILLILHALSLSSLTCLDVFTLVLLLGIGVFTVFLTVKFNKMEMRKYKLTEDGISLNDKGETFYSWESIDKIGIAAFGSSASLQNYQTVICVLLEHEPPFFWDRILHSYLYGLFKQKTVVIIDYTPSVLESIAFVYPRQILDYRKQQLPFLHGN